MEFIDVHSTQRPKGDPISEESRIRQMGIHRDQILKDMHHCFVSAMNLTFPAPDYILATTCRIILA